jgi:hypothetical protein
MSNCGDQEFARANREETQFDWLVANTDVITTQSHSLFSAKFNFAVL